MSGDTQQEREVRVTDTQREVLLEAYRELAAFACRVDRHDYARERTAKVAEQIKAMLDAPAVPEPAPRRHQWELPGGRGNIFTCKECGDRSSRCETTKCRGYWSAYQIVSKVCNEARNSDLRADDRRIIAAFDEALREAHRCPPELERALEREAAGWEAEGLRKKIADLERELSELREAVSPGRLGFSKPEWYIGLAKRMRERE